MSESAKAGEATVHKLTVRIEPDESEAVAVARVSLQPSVQAGMTIAHYNARGIQVPSLDELISQLASQGEKAVAGDLSRCEATLSAQAATLDAIFNDLARRTRENFNNLNVAERLMRLALKAQSNCRSTIEALGELKHPKAVAFVKQANIANNQQVNNVEPRDNSRDVGAVRAGVRGRAEKITSAPNKLLEQTNGERLEFGAPGEAAGANPDLATVGALNGAADGRGQISSRSQRG